MFLHAYKLWKIAPQAKIWKKLYIFEVPKSQNQNLGAFYLKLTFCPSKPTHLGTFCHSRFTHLGTFRPRKPTSKSSSPLSAKIFESPPPDPLLKHRSTNFQKRNQVYPSSRNGIRTTRLCQNYLVLTKNSLCTDITFYKDQTTLM